MLNYINETVHRIEGAFAWDVINEAISDDPNEYIKQSPWSGIDNFICKAFKAARAANPNAKLFYNDYNVLTMDGWRKTKADKMFKLVQQLKNDDCGITGVGFQSHVTIHNEQDSSEEAVKAHMKRYADIGIEVHITELDISCKD